MSTARELSTLLGRKLPRSVTVNIAEGSGAPKKTKKEAGHVNRQGKKKAKKAELAERQKRDKKHNPS